MNNKPGWQTSEFWVVAVTSIIGLVNQAAGLNIDSTTLASVAGVVATYVIGRTMVKK